MESKNARKIEVQEDIHRLIQEMMQLRKEGNYSQAQIAELLGANSHARISAIENEKSIPKLDTVLKLLSVYGKTLSITDKKAG